MKSHTMVALAILLGCVALSAQQRPLKVMVLYDMEGVSGASNVKHTQFAHPTEYAEGRKSLTADVNAAVAGLKAAGATEIVIVDGHGSGNNTEPDVLEKELLPPAKMMYRDAPFDIYMESYDHSFDAIVAIGMHAGAGNSVGFLSHTYTYEDVDYRVNGVPVNETMILAMGAGRLKIPVIMVSGDDQLEREIRRMLPWVRFATVKHAVDRSKAEPLPRAEVDKRIESAAREALLGLASAKVPDFPGPYRFTLTFQDTTQATFAGLVPGAEVRGNTVEVRSNDFEEGYHKSVRLIALASTADRNTGLNTIVGSHELRLEMSDWLTERWLTGTAPGTPGAAPGAAPKRKFWGAN